MTATRQQRLDDLRTLINFLEAHPDVPLGNSGPTEFAVLASSDEKGMAILRAIAAALGADLTCNEDGSQYLVTRRFGAARYTAFYCTRESMRQHDEDQRWIEQRRGES